MIAIINEKEEIIPYVEGKIFNVKETDIGFGIYLDDDLVEEYGTQQLAYEILCEILKRIASDAEYIKISEIHQEYKEMEEVKEYKVCITETLQKVVTVEAEDEADAIRKVHDMYRNEEVILYPEDYMDTEFDIFLD